MLQQIGDFRMGGAGLQRQIPPCVERVQTRFAARGLGFLSFENSTKLNGLNNFIPLYPALTSSKVISLLFFKLLESKFKLIDLFSFVGLSI